MTPHRAAIPGGTVFFALFTEEKQVYNTSIPFQGGVFGGL